MNTNRIKSRYEKNLEMELGIVSRGGARIPTDDAQAVLLFCQTLVGLVNQLIVSDEPGQSKGMLAVNPDAEALGQ